LREREREREENMSMDGDETEGLERRSYGHEDGAEWSNPKLTIYQGLALVISRFKRPGNIITSKKEKKERKKGNIIREMI